MISFRDDMVGRKALRAQRVAECCTRTGLFLLMFLKGTTIILNDVDNKN